MAVWLWSSKDNRSTLFLSIVLLTGLSATASSVMDSEPEWWSDPCSRQIRHGRSTADDRQLNVFIKRIDKIFLRDLKALYPHAHQNKAITGKCLRVNSFLKSIRVAPNKREAKKVFYETMIQMARFIDKLKDIPVKTNAKFNVSKRKNLYEETKENLRLVMCEFNETLARDDENSISAVPSTAKVPKLKSKCLPRTFDLSKAQMFDKDFFNKLRKFFKRSRMILRKMTKGGKKWNKNRKDKHKKRTNQSKNLVQ